MPSKNGDSGCVALGILILCLIIIVPMIIGFVGQGLRELIKQQPGVVFIVAVLVGIFAFTYLYDKSKQ